MGSSLGILSRDGNWVFEPIGIPKPRMRESEFWLQLDGQHAPARYTRWYCEGNGITEYGPCARSAYAEWCDRIKHRYVNPAFAGIDLWL